MLLERLVASYEELSEELVRLQGASEELTAVTIERNELRLRVAELEDDSGVSRELATLVRDTLVSAQQAANELRAEAKREVDELRTQARKEAARALADSRSAANMVASAEKQRDRLAQECQQLRAQLERLEGDVAAVAFQAPLAPGVESLDEPLPPGATPRDGDRDSLHAALRDVLAPADQPGS